MTNTFNHFSVLMGNTDDNRGFISAKSRPKKNNLNQYQNQNQNQNKNQYQNQNKYQNQARQNNTIISIKEKQSINTMSNNSMSKEKNKIDCFDVNQFNAATDDMDSKRKAIIYSPYSDEEYQETLKFVCEKYDSKDYPCDKDNWFAMTEAEDIIKDKERISRGLKPIHSTTMREPVVVNLPKPTSFEIIEEEIFETPAPFIRPIALVREWQNDSKVWESEIVAIMKNPDDFWDVIKELNRDSEESRFGLPLLGKDADGIFTELLSSGKRGNLNDKSGKCANLNDKSDKCANLNDHSDDTVTIEFATSEQSKKKNVGEMVSTFNNLHPTWSFIKVDNDCTKDSIIPVPFIRDKSKRAINCMDINLKDTKKNAQIGIRPMDVGFEFGYIPKLILEFIGGTLPDDIAAIVFSRTIPICKNIYFKGYRVRVLASTANMPSLTKCKFYIENNFVKNHKKTCDFSECIVNISLPK